MPRHIVSSPSLCLAVGAMFALLVAACGTSDPPEEASQPRADTSVADEETVETAASAGLGDPAETRLRFRDVTAEAGLLYMQHEFRETPDCLFAGYPRGATGCMLERATGGAATADYDGDGWPDLYVTRLDGPGVLFRNQGDGSFRDATEEAGLAGIPYPTNGAWWGDIDNDGDADLFLTTIAAPRFLLFINDGSGRFTEEAIERGAAVADDAPRGGMSVAMGDFDRDGWLDIHTTEWRLAVYADGRRPSTRGCSVIAARNVPATSRT